MDYLIKHWQLGRWFKGFFCSAYLEIAKPDKRFYEIVLKTTGKTPVELLYIDDSERNIKAAAGLGIRVIIYAKNQDLRLSLERNGIVLKKNN